DEDLVSALGGRGKLNAATLTFRQDDRMVSPSSNGDSSNRRPVVLKDHLALKGELAGEVRGRGVSGSVLATANGQSSDYDCQVLHNVHPVSSIELHDQPHRSLRPPGLFIRFCAFSCSSNGDRVD